MCNHVVLSGCLCAALFAGAASSAAAEAPDPPVPEPNAEIARQWWPEFENVWTPIGWKDHFLRFNVLYNGTIVAEPRK